MTTSDDVTSPKKSSESEVENFAVKNDEKNVDNVLHELEKQFDTALSITSTDKKATKQTSNGDTEDKNVISLPPKTVDNIMISEKFSATNVISSTATKEFSNSLHKIASLIDNAKQILILSGAGVSVAAGIPDFRTPGTGLYDNLQKYDLPYAEAVFDIQFYATNPNPFVQLASELWPDHHFPTITHSFISLLAEKRRLLRNYTQNIDGLESMAGLPDNLLVECHGHFRSASCIRCKKEASMKYVKECIVLKKEVPVCQYCKTNKSNLAKQRPGYVKPDIVFFGENLPNRFHDLLPKDVEKADLCIIMGTSLQVPPTAYIPEMVNCKRVLLNRELVGNFNENGEDEDIFEGGDCDASIVSIARILGWDYELHTKHDTLIKSLEEIRNTASIS